MTITDNRIPLLNDHHSHPSAYAAMNACLDLRGVTDKERALELIRHRHDDLVFVLGWSNSLYSFDSDDLDSLPPVFISNESLHGFVMNDDAGRRLRRDYPDIVANIADQDWIERHLDRILRMIVGVRGCRPDDIRVFFDRLLELGVWSAEEMLLFGAEEIDTFVELGYLDRTVFWANPEVYETLDDETREHVHSIKLFTDGAFASRSAAMAEPFLSGDPGILLRSDEDLRTTLTALREIGKPVAIHAIGDRAIEQVVSTVEELQRDLGEHPPVRIEHASLITPDQARRAKALGMTLSMQPNFNIESVSYSDRLSERDRARIYPYRMLIDDAGFVPGEDLILGSDGMPHGAEYALQQSLFPPHDAQRLTLDELVAGYCLPDESRGHIEIEIDDAARQVRVIGVCPARSS
jgi:predicted amidohydrolase YtcJ